VTLPREPAHTSSKPAIFRGLFYGSNSCDTIPRQGAKLFLPVVGGGAITAPNPRQHSAWRASAPVNKKRLIMFLAHPHQLLAAFDLQCFATV